jgi:hypothetical protein
VGDPEPLRRGPERERVAPVEPVAERQDLAQLLGEIREPGGERLALEAQERLLGHVGAARPCLLVALLGRRGDRAPLALEKTVHRLPGELPEPRGELATLSRVIARDRLPRRAHAFREKVVELDPWPGAAGREPHEEPSVGRQERGHGVAVASLGSDDQCGLVFDLERHCVWLLRSPRDRPVPLGVGLASTPGILPPHEKACLWLDLFCVSD